LAVPPASPADQPAAAEQQIAEEQQAPPAAFEQGFAGLGAWLDDLLGRIPWFFAVSLVGPQVLICCFLLYLGSHSRRGHPGRLRAGVPRPSLERMGHVASAEATARPPAPSTEAGERFQLGPSYEEERQQRDAQSQQQDSGVLGDIFAENLRLQQQIGSLADFGNLAVRG
jgi:hypothetical protein